MSARLKRVAHGLNDAPRLWWNRLDKVLRMVLSLRALTVVAMCCFRGTHLNGRSQLLTLQFGRRSPGWAS
eukprot:12931340-Prorocentrum_lima.AAC.1